MGHVVSTKLRELDFIKKHVSERAFKIIEKELLRREEEVTEHYEWIITNLLDAYSKK